MVRFSYDSGIVGSSLAEILPRLDAPGGIWKVYGVARRPKPNWSPDTPVEYIQCDVLNTQETLQKLSPLTDVTHIFWVVWVSRDTEEKNCEDNGRILFGQIGPHETPFHEELPRLPGPNFYHSLEDILFETAKQKAGLTWSIHRPSTIFGFSPSSLMNIVGTLAVYASICKQEGLALRYPGNSFTWERLSDVSDAGLIAEQQIWAVTSPDTKDQAFNCSNGDVFRWKTLWYVLADKFGLEVPPYDGKPFNLEEAMKDKGPLWDSIVEENKLQKTRLEEVGNWWFANIVLNVELENVSSMNKSKEYGFFGFRNTEKSLVEWIDRMREAKIIP
eukprot:Gb_08120 [translate_table: standard]